MHKLIQILFAGSIAAFTPVSEAGSSIHSLTSVIQGHSVGGVTVDLVGNVYVADFGEIVWKITPDGERTIFTSGLYGASGNAIDGAGNLLQASCYGNYLTRIDRQGVATTIAANGLDCPVGIAVSRKTGDIFVANCSGNSIARVTPDGVVSTFARSELFNCPNGIAFGPGEDLYVVNFRKNTMLKIGPTGTVMPFAEVSENGLGHLCFKDDRFYVTASQSHAIYSVELNGAATRVLGSGQRGIADGEGTQARLSFPNGIACHPWTQRLYINEFVNESTSSLPPRAIIREVVLDPRPPAS